MKALIPTTLLVFVMMLVASCSKDDSPTSMNKDVTSNKWKVSYYWDKDKDETHKFQGMEFNFKSDQTVEVTTSGAPEYGSWLIDTSDDSHDHFVISLPDKDPFDELNDDWEIIKITDSKIELKDVSGSGGTEYLTFIKI